MWVKVTPWLDEIELFVHWVGRLWLVWVFLLVLLLLLSLGECLAVEGVDTQRFTLDVGDTYVFVWRDIPAFTSSTSSFNQVNHRSSLEFLENSVLSGVPIDDLQVAGASLEQVTRIKLAIIRVITVHQTRLEWVIVDASELGKIVNSNSTALAQSLF